MPQKIPFSRAGPNKVLFPYLEKLKSARTRPNYPLVLVAELNRPKVRSQRALEIVPLIKRGTCYCCRAQFLGEESYYHLFFLSSG